MPKHGREGELGLGLSSRSTGFDRPYLERREERSNGWPRSGWPSVPERYRCVMITSPAIGNVVGRRRGAEANPRRPAPAACASVALARSVGSITSYCPMSGFVPNTEGVIRRPAAVAMALDTLGILAAVSLAGLVCGLGWTTTLVLFVFSAGVRLFSLSSSEIYRASWYLFAFRDAVRFSMAWGLSFPLVLLSWWWAGQWADGFAFSLAMSIEVFAGYLILVTMRAGARGITEFSELAGATIMNGPKKRAIVVGAGSTAVMVVRHLNHNRLGHFEVVGLVDDDPRKWGVHLEGVRVLGGIDAIQNAAKICDADCMILAMPTVDGERMHRVLGVCQGTGLALYTVPEFDELLTGQLELSTIRPLRMPDLLRRQPVDLRQPEWKEVSQRFSGKSILVTGAGGSVGSELCRQLAGLEPSRLVMLDRSENDLFEIDREVTKKLKSRAHCELVDIRDIHTLQAVFQEHRPQVVFHAAAFKHVPMMERHPRAAIENNIVGTRNVAQLADRFGAEHFVQVSSDKAVNPSNIMGASKRIAEMITQSLGRKSQTKFSCVRFGNVLGSRGSVIHTFQRQIDLGGPVTVTHPEVTRYFMTIHEAVSLVIQAAACGQGGETYLLDMGQPVKILDLAKSMIRLSGRDEDEIPIEFVGLRPGEKLSEELLLGAEELSPCGLEKVKKVSSASVSELQVRELVGLLEKSALAGDAAQIRKILVGAGIGFGGSDSRKGPDLPKAGSKATPAYRRVS